MYAVLTGSGGGLEPHPAATATADPIEQLLDGGLRREAGQLSGGEMLLERLALPQIVPLQCRMNLFRDVSDEHVGHAFGGQAHVDGGYRWSLVRQGPKPEP